MDSNYYVYQHIRNDNGNVFYVGKGRNDRALLHHRNDRHDEIVEKYGMSIEYVYTDLTEEEAYQKEREVIEDLIYNHGYGIDITGLEGDNPDKCLTNQTFGSRGSVGISNPMYGVSPSERMDDEKYAEWLNKTTTRLKAQVGELNPNWHNDTLHNKVKDDPELRIQYYARPGKQNGRCRKVDLYDKQMNFIKSFDYIGECAEYVKKIKNAKGSIDTIRSNITIYSKKNKPYLGFFYKLY